MFIFKRDRIDRKGIRSTARNFDEGGNIYGIMFKGQ